MENSLHKAGYKWALEQFTKGKSWQYVLDKATDQDFMNQNFYEISFLEGVKTAVREERAKIEGDISCLKS